MELYIVQPVRVRQMSRSPEKVKSIIERNTRHVLKISQRVSPDFHIDFVFFQLN
jgi:hypothetical protein